VKSYRVSSGPNHWECKSIRHAASSVVSGYKFTLKHMGPTADCIGSTHFKLGTRLYAGCDFWFLKAWILNVSPQNSGPKMATSLKTKVWIGQLLEPT
jgi:hypothetical protein